jgi:hypothetical protein
MKSKLLASIMGAIASGVSHLNPFRKTKPTQKLKGAFGGLNRKNPFKGIACATHRVPHYSRHIEGARDTRPTFHTHHRDQCLRRIFDRTIVIPTHRDSNPIPCVFLP